VLPRINSRTTVLKAKHCSISWPGALWWKAQKRSGLYHVEYFFGIGGGSLVWIRFSLSSVENSSAYFTIIGPTRDAFWAWFWGVARWKACCRGCCAHEGWSRVAISEDIKLVNFSTSARSVVTSSRSSWTSCPSWSISRVCASACICEPKLKEDIGPLLTFLEKKTLWDSDFETMKCNMMHDVYAKDTFLLKGLSKWIEKHCRGTLFEICKDIAIGSLFKSKNETQEKVLNKR